MEIVAIITIAFLILCVVTGYRNEKIYFNNGRCYKCGNQMKHFANDIQGCRGYICDKCKIAIWVSYSSIDKEFINNEQNNL